MTVRGRVKNLKDVNKKLADLAKSVDAATLAEIVEVALEPVKNDAKIKAPVLTGNLRRSIRTAVSVSGIRVDGRVGTNVEYAPFQEFGTAYIAGKAYLRKAWDENEDEVVSLIVVGVVENIEETV